jgi:hypothetical protein
VFGKQDNTDATNLSAIAAGTGGFVLLTGYWRTPRLHEQVVKDISNGEMLNKKEKHDKTRTTIYLHFI